MATDSDVYRAQLIEILEAARDSSFGIRINCEKKDIDSIRRKIYHVRKTLREEGDSSFENLFFRIGEGEILYLLPRHTDEVPDAREEE